MADAWIQRFDERADEDERYDRHLRLERADRLTEKASLEPWQARMDIEALQPDLAALPSLRYQGTPPALPRFYTGWRLLWRWLKVIAFVIAAWVLALAVAVTIFMAVAWALGNGS
jgi:hypothetical protein